MELEKEHTEKSRLTPFPDQLYGQIQAASSHFKHTLTKVTAAAIVGGTASLIGGGKFENGAVTGAFSALTIAFITDSTFRSNIFNGIKKVGNFLRDTVFGTPAELRTMNWNIFDWRAYNHVGSGRVNGLDVKNQSEYEELYSSVPGTAESMNKLDDGTIFSGAKGHDNDFYSDPSGYKKAYHDLQLAVDASLAIIPGGSVPSAPIIPSLITAGGMTIAAPLHAIGLSP